MLHNYNFAFYKMYTLSCWVEFLFLPLQQVGTEARPVRTTLLMMDAALMPIKDHSKLSHKLPIVPNNVYTNHS